MENAQTAALTTRSVGIRYGVILGIVGFIYFLILAVTGLHTSKPTQYGGWVISIVVLVLAHKYFKENGDGFMSYSQGIGIAFWTGLISSIISGPLMYLYMKVLDTTYIDKIRENAVMEMEAQGQSEEQMEMAMKFVNTFTSAEMIFIFALVFGIIGMVIFGLIVSIFTQKNRPQAI